MRSTRPDRRLDRMRAKLRRRPAFTRSAAALQLALLAVTAGCAALSRSMIFVDGASPDNPDAVARVAVDTERPVVLRAVDEKALPDIRVSSRLRSVTYVLRPGTHVLWASSAPYGLPLVPQRLKCYVIRAGFVAGAVYTLRFDVHRQAPVLGSPTAPEPQVMGVLVDEPLISERGCKWH
jgi:hypothetical protein